MLTFIGDAIIRNLRVFSYKKFSRGRAGCGVNRMQSNLQFNEEMSICLRR